MTIEHLFVLATRNKFRFDSKVGLLTVEDLWELPLTAANKANLDDVAIKLSKALKETEESFVTAKSARDTTISQKLDIVKHVIQTRMDENKAVLEAKAKADQREKIKGLISAKEDEGLKSLSLEELKAIEASL